MNLIKEAAYKALDVVTFGRGVARRIGGESIKFPARWSRYYEAEYEQETFRFLYLVQILLFSKRLVSIFNI